MRKSYIYKTIGNDLVYVNNIGNEYLLTEAVSPFGDGTYDIIVAFPMDKSVGDLEFGLFDAVDDPKWFAGACYVKDYMSGKSKELLKACHDYLDEEPKEEDHPIADIFYTGGGIYCGILKVEDGWFMAEANGWGEIWDSYESAMENNDPENHGVRCVEDLNEQIAIWVELYSKYAKKLDEEDTDIHCEMWEHISNWQSSLYEDLTNC
jgi:hypothetical protein